MSQIRRLMEVFERDHQKVAEELAATKSELAEAQSTIESHQRKSAEAVAATERMFAELFDELVSQAPDGSLRNKLWRIHDAIARKIHEDAAAAAEATRYRREPKVPTPLTLIDLLVAMG